MSSGPHVGSCAASDASVRGVYENSGLGVRKRRNTQLELAESWLANACPAVVADFSRFIGPESKAYPLSQLRAELISWAARLATAPGERR